MNSLTATDYKTDISHKRIIESIKGGEDGPTVIFLAGIHGNEPGGVEAVSRVLEYLKSRKKALTGQLLGIRANIKALESGVRYIDEDMNRIWFPSIIEKIREKKETELASSERRETKRLISIIEDFILSTGKTNSPIFLVDLHTFSAEGWMFSMTSTIQEQIDLLSELHVPMVFGIDETLKGTALNYYQKQGFMCFGLEGGQHSSELTIYNTAASIMLLLNAAGCINREQIPGIEEYEAHLRDHTISLPEKTELVYQHIIEPGDNFRMRPGFKNFQPVKEGEWLATDNEGKIHAQCDGFILMPLYQKQGDDGFFIIREHDS